MRFSVLTLFGTLVLTGCSKTAPAPPTLIGGWNLEFIRYQFEDNNAPPHEDTYVAAPGEPPQEFTTDGRVFYRRFNAPGSFRPYRFDGTTIVVSLGTIGDIQWTVRELSAHRLVYQEVEENYIGRLTQTFTYNR